MLLSYYRRPLFLLLLAYAGTLFLLRGRLLEPEPLPFPLPRSGVPVTGRVTEYPAAAPGGARFALRTESVYGRPLEAGLMVYAAGRPDASYGDTVELLADLSLPRGAETPGGLDWAGYLSGRGITAEARALELRRVRSAGPVLRLARRFRESALTAFRRGLSGEAAAVFGGIVLGEKRSVPAELKAAFQDSGAMHLLVASGSNVGFVVAVVYFLCSRLGLGRRRAGLAALALAGFYVLAAGLDAPLVRAYLMFSAGLLAYLLRRESGTFQALCAAALLILLAEPRSLFDAGFQMSFLAAYGLTVGMAAWGRHLEAGGPALGLPAVSFFAQLCLYPLLAVYFRRVSLVSLLSNLVLVPASGAAMGLGFGLALSGGMVFRALAWTGGVFMAAFLWLVRFFAGLPFAAVSVPEPSAPAVAGALALGLVALHAPLLGFRRPRLYAAAGAAAALFLAGLFTGRTAASRGVAVSLFGYRETSCALVSLPSGLYLVNPGLSGAKLAAAVLSSGAERLEGVVLTSLERRNYSGLKALASKVKIRTVLLPPGPEPPSLRAALAAAREGGSGVKVLWPGEEAAGAGPDWNGRGYTGRGDSYSWRIGPVRLSGGGGLAEWDCGGRRTRLSAERGKVVAGGFAGTGDGCGGWTSGAGVGFAQPGQVGALLFHQPAQAGLFPGIRERSLQRGVELRRFQLLPDRESGQFLHGGLRLRRLGEETLAFHLAQELRPRRQVRRQGPPPVQYVLDEAPVLRLLLGQPGAELLGVRVSGRLFHPQVQVRSLFLQHHGQAEDVAQPHVGAVLGEGAARGRGGVRRAAAAQQQVQQDGRYGRRSDNVAVVLHGPLLVDIPAPGILQVRTALLAVQPAQPGAVGGLGGPPAFGRAQGPQHQLGEARARRGAVLLLRAVLAGDYHYVALGGQFRAGQGPQPLHGGFRQAGERGGEA